MQKKSWNLRKFFVVAVFVLAGIMVADTHVSVQAADLPVSMTSCKLNSSAKKLTVKAKVKTKTSAMGKKLYLLNLDANASETGQTSTKSIASVKAKKGTITFNVKYNSSMLFQKFVVAYKKGSKYTIVSDVKYITNPEKLAIFSGKGPKAASKKGLQVEDVTDSLELGTKHAVVNWTLNSLLNDKAVNKTSFQYKNKTYYLDADQLSRNDELVRRFNAEGVRVTVILLLAKDAASTGTKAMQFGGYTYTLYSSFKTSNAKGCRTFEAVMSYLAKRYGTKENLVSGWILGNEVNSACIWNYGGNKSLDSYMANYARAFRICYNAVKSVSKNSNVYISLDNNWNNDADGSGKRYFSTKATLDKFYEKIKAQGNITFQIAYHAYPQGMSDPIFWDDTQATNSVNTKIVNFKNLKVLTNYVKKNMGKNYKIMLSEQSFNSSRGEAVQAAAYAYAYYISESNSMIEALIYGREFDHPSEMSLGYRWGLCDNWRAKRLIWSVYQYIDSKDSLKFTNPLLQYTNIKKWGKISGFKKSKYTAMPSKFAKASITDTESISTTSVKISWDKLNSGDGYELYRDGRLIATIKENTNVSYEDKGLVAGNTYQYSVRMYKEAPKDSDANQRVKLYGTLSSPVSVTVSTGQVVINEENCEADGNQIKIAWKKLANVSGYEISRAVQENGVYTVVGKAEANSSSYTDTAPAAGTTYYYKVRAFVTVNGVNYYGNYSDPISKLARIQLTVKIENGKVVLSWTKYQNITRYRLYCKPQSQSNYIWIKTANNALTYSCDSYSAKGGTDSVIVKFVPGVTYDFRVRAVLSTSPDTFSKYSNEPSIVIDESVNPVGSGEDSLEMFEIPDTEESEPIETEETETLDIETVEPTEIEETEILDTEETIEPTEAKEVEPEEPAEMQDTEVSDTEQPEPDEAQDTKLLDMKLPELIQ